MMWTGARARRGALLKLALLAAACSDDFGLSEVTGDDDTATAMSVSGGEATSESGDSSAGVTQPTGATGATSGAGTAGTTGGEPPPPSGSSGCGLDGVTGTFHQSVDVMGQERTYFVSVPDDYDPAHEYPLVFGYHGGDDFGGQAMRDYLGLEWVEPAGGEIFVYPDASAVNNPGGTGWEYGVTDAAKADDAFFDAMLATMVSSYCIDENRVFVTGQSAGGGYTSQLACHRGDVLRAAVPVAANIVLCGDTTCSGWGGTHPSLCTGQPSVMQMHSPEDWIEYNPFGLGTFEYLASAAGCGVWTEQELMIAALGTLPMSDISTPTCQQREGCSGEMILCSYSGGHQIPGWGGPAEFEYAQVTMDFFRAL